jgi:hypothetical protein
MHERSRLLPIIDCDPGCLVGCPAMISAAAFLPIWLRKQSSLARRRNHEPSRVLVLNQARAQAI